MTCFCAYYLQEGCGYLGWAVSSTSCQVASCSFFLSFVVSKGPSSSVFHYSEKQQDINYPVALPLHKRPLWENHTIPSSQKEKKPLYLQSAARDYLFFILLCRDNDGCTNRTDERDEREKGLHFTAVIVCSSIHTYLPAYLFTHYKPPPLFCSPQTFSRIAVTPLLANERRRWADLLVKRGSFTGYLSSRISSLQVLLVIHSI